MNLNTDKTINKIHMDKFERLNNLKEFMDNGVLTKSEYDNFRKKILYSNDETISAKYNKNVTLETVKSFRENSFISSNELNCKWSLEVKATAILMMLTSGFVILISLLNPEFRVGFGHDIKYILRFIYGILIPISILFFAISLVSDEKYIKLKTSAIISITVSVLRMAYVFLFYFTNANENNFSHTYENILSLIVQIVMPMSLILFSLSLLTPQKFLNIKTTAILLISSASILVLISYQLLPNRILRYFEYSDYAILLLLPFSILMLGLTFLIISINKKNFVLIEKRPQNLIKL